MCTQFEPRWVIDNIFNAWAYILTLGLLRGAFWLLGSFTADVTGFVVGLLDSACGPRDQWASAALVDMRA